MQQLSSTSLASSISPAARRPLTVSTARPPLVGSSSSFAPPQQRQRPATEAARRASVEMPSPPSSSRGRPGTGLVAAVQSSGGPASQELAFDRVYDHLIHEESTFVANLDRMITLHEHSRARKTKALYNEWESEVRLPRAWSLRRLCRPCTLTRRASAQAAASLAAADIACVRAPTADL